MKGRLISSLALAALLGSGTGMAAIEVPSGIYSADQVRAALKEAEKDKKTIAFVLTDPGSN